MNALTVIAATNPYPFVCCINRVVSATRVTNYTVAEAGEFVWKYLINAAVLGENSDTAEYRVHTVPNHLPIILDVIVVRIR
jgi:hypothetical protein